MTDRQLERAGDAPIALSQTLATWTPTSPVQLASSVVLASEIAWATHASMPTSRSWLGVAAASNGKLFD